MELIIMDATLLDSLIESLNTLADEAGKISCGKASHSQTWLDNQDVCEILNLCYRSLQTLRDSGKIGFSQFGHKIFYKPEDVELLLNNSRITK